MCLCARVQFALVVGTSHSGLLCTLSHAHFGPSDVIYVVGLRGSFNESWPGQHSVAVSLHGDAHRADNEIVGASVPVALPPATVSSCWETRG